MHNELWVIWDDYLCLFGALNLKDIAVGLLGYLSFLGVKGIEQTTLVLEIQRTVLQKSFLSKKCVTGTNCYAHRITL